MLQQKLRPSYPWLGVDVCRFTPFSKTEFDLSQDLHRAQSNRLRINCTNLQNLPCGLQILSVWSFYMTMLHYIGKNTTSSSAVSTTAEVNLSNPTQESHGLNQSDTLRNVDDSAFPFAAVVVPVLIGLAVVLVVVLVIGYKFRDNLRDWINCNSQENRNNIDLTVEEGPDLNEADQDTNEDQANTSVLPLMTQDNGV